MRVSIRLFLFLLLSLSLLPAPTEAHEGVLSTYRLHQPAPAHLKLVARLFEIERRTNQTFDVVVPEEQASLLLALEPGAQLVERDRTEAVRERLREYALQSNALGTKYHSFEEVQEWAKNLEARYPELVRLVQYGSSQGKRPLFALRIRKDEEERPAAMITAATHGDELITTEVLMALVDQLLAGQGIDERLTQIVNRHDLYFVPVVNPDGFARQSRYDNGSDPNRSYPYPGHENPTPTPSIAGIMKLFSGLRLSGSIDFHAYGELIMYPWAYTHAPVEAGAQARFHSLTGHMAEANQYTFGPISDVIYLAPGSSADYYFWKSGSWSLGIEIGHNKVPRPSEIQAYVESQTESTWRFLESL